MWTRSLLSLLLAGCFTRPELITGDGGGEGIACGELANAPGLVAYLPFETVGITTPDLSPFHHEGTLSGDVMQTQGRDRNGLRWSAENSQVSLGSPDSLDQLPALTVCMWIQPAPHSDAMSLADKSSTGTAGGWNMYVLPGGGTYALGFVNRSRVYEESGHVIPMDGAWTHVCVTWDGQDNQNVGGALDGMHLYADASDLHIQSVVENDHRLPESDAGEVLRLGDVSGGTDYTFRGVMDEVLIFNRVLPPGDISAIRDCAL